MHGTKVGSRQPAESAREQQWATVSTSVFRLYIFVVVRHVRVGALALTPTPRQSYIHGLFESHAACRQANIDAEWWPEHCRLRKADAPAL